MNRDNIERITLIREYENSVEMPETERKTYLDENNTVHLKTGDHQAFSQELAEYAQTCKEYLRFGDDVDLVTSGSMDEINQLCVCQTPSLLQCAGFKDQPMLYTQKHLLDALHPKSEENYHWHGLKVHQIKRLPELLEKPVMLCDSPARDDVLLAVLADVDTDKLPLIVAIKPDGKGNYQLQEIETNFILSVYGKKNFIKYFEERITPDKVIYINVEQAHKLEALAEFQLLRCHPQAYELDKLIIRKPQCIVNHEDRAMPSLNTVAHKAKQNSANVNTQDSLMKESQER